MSNMFKVGRPWLAMFFNLAYCKVMSIAIYDMQSEDIEAQCILWRKLNATILKKGVANPNFKGFMADNAQANWNVVRIVYGIRDPISSWLTMKILVFFHWIQSRNTHTKKLIASKFQD